MFRYLPEQASEIAPKIDWINYLITDIATFFTIAIVGTMLYFVIRYRAPAGKTRETPQIHGNDLLEVLWTVVPALISAYVLYWGIRYYNEIRTVPKDALTINVTGRKWSWEFEYENGKKTQNELVVPVRKPVKLVMRSADVIHSLFIPVMRVKSDVLPNHFTYVSFTPVKTGDYRVFCTEYCGDNHWNMLAGLRVVSDEEYGRWYNDRSAELIAARQSPVERGRSVYEQRCSICHTSQADLPGVGPTFAGLYGKERTFTDGSKSIADERYIEESIYNPTAKVVQGYQPGMMPTFLREKSASDLQAVVVSEDELKGLVAFIKNIDQLTPVATPRAPDLSAPTKELNPAERGAQYARNYGCTACHSLDGSKLLGPSFQGLWSKKGTLSGGENYVADEQYIKRSIREPSAAIAKGFEGLIMPPFAPLKEAEIEDIIAYLKSLKN